MKIPSEGISFTRSSFENTLRMDFQPAVSKCLTPPYIFAFPISFWSVPLSGMFCSSATTSRFASILSTVHPKQSFFKAFCDSPDTTNNRWILKTSLQNSPHHQPKITQYQRNNGCYHSVLPWKYQRHHAILVASCSLHTEYTAVKCRIDWRCFQYALPAGEVWPVGTI